MAGLAPRGCPGHGLSQSAPVSHTGSHCGPRDSDTARSQAGAHDSDSTRLGRKGPYYQEKLPWRWGGLDRSWIVKKRKGTVGSLGGCNQTGRRPSPHEGHSAFSIFDPPSMEPCRGKHMARARIPEGSSPQISTFGPRSPVGGASWGSPDPCCLRRWRFAPAGESTVTLVCEPPEGLPLS